MSHIFSADSAALPPGHEMFPAGPPPAWLQPGQASPGGPGLPADAPAPHPVWPALPSARRPP